MASLIFKEWVSVACTLALLSFGTEMMAFVMLDLTECKLNVNQLKLSSILYSDIT